MSVLTSTLGTRRRLRWFAFVSGLVFTAGAVAALIVFLGNTGTKINAPVSNAPAQVVKNQKSVPLDPKARLVAGRFINTAVARKNLAASWSLVSDQLKAGFTKQRWLTGDIPVVPFTAKIGQARMKIDVSEPRHALLEVLLLPVAAGVKPAFFIIELKKVAERWLVVSWTPRANFAVPASVDN